MRIEYVVSNQTNPFLNIAVENYLLSRPCTDTIVLYLWSNRRTVVIGQNQNPYAECNVALLETEGGYLMRRRTGGGAVYHDEGNLNFSFIVPKAYYNQARQFSVLQKAVASFGIKSEVSGRNDVLCEGRKFSGNAFSRGRYNDLHHGTILIRSNMDDLQRYLRPKPAKLMKHGVNSVQSRVVNLSDLNPQITSHSIQPYLLKAFEDVYGQAAELLEFDEVVSIPEVLQLRDEFASDEWRLGQWLSFKAQRSAQYDWGGVEVSLAVVDNIITQVDIASDALDLQAIDTTKKLLIGASVEMTPSSQNPIVADIVSLVYETDNKPCQ